MFVETQTLGKPMFVDTPNIGENLCFVDTPKHWGKPEPVETQTLVKTLTLNLMSWVQGTYLPL